MLTEDYKARELVNAKIEDFLLKERDVEKSNIKEIFWPRNLEILPLRYPFCLNLASGVVGRDFFAFDSRHDILSLELATEEGQIDFYQIVGGKL